MRRLCLSAILTAFTMLLAGCDFEDMDWGDFNRYKENFSYGYKLSPGGRIFLESFNGSVEVLGTDSDAVQITGTKYARREDIMKQMKIEVVAEPSSIRIRAIRPMERNCNCGASFVLRVPKKVTLDRIDSSNGSMRLEAIEGPARVSTSNGSIRTWGLKGDLDARTSNGSIEVNQFQGAASLRTSNGRIRAEGVRGNFDAQTSNASIDVTIAELDASRPLRLTTSNGSITAVLEKWNNNDIIAHSSNSSVNLRLPDAVNANLRASTSNGSISSDFDVTTRELSKTHLDGKIGSGGSLIDLSTSNGSIHLMKR